MGVGTVVANYDSGSTADNPGPPFTGILGVVATPEPGMQWVAGVALIGVVLVRKRLLQTRLRQ
jgi:hypothetical protein